MNTLIVMGITLLGAIIALIVVKLDESDNPKAKRFLKKIGML